MQDAAATTYAMSTFVFETFQKNPNLLKEAVSAYNAKDQEIEKINRQAIDRALSQYTAVKKENIEDKVEQEKEKKIESRLKYITELDASY